MVRKWSYLTSSNALPLNQTLRPLSKCYLFKVFRMTTRFKKYQRNETSFVRKQDSSRKRQTSWLTLLGILSQWSLQYIKYKQYVRYYQNVGLYKHQMIIPNIFVIQKKLNLFNSELSFTTSTLTTQLAETFQKQSPLLSNNILLTNTTTLLILKEVNIAGNIYENQTFIESPSLSMVRHSVVDSLNLFTNKTIMSQISEFYKVLILLTLYNNIYYEVKYTSQINK